MKKTYIKPTIKSQKITINRFYQAEPPSAYGPGSNMDFYPIQLRKGYLAAGMTCNGRLVGNCAA